MSRQVQLPESPSVQLLGDSAVIRGAAAIDAHRLLVRGIADVKRTDGISPSPRLLELVAVLQVAADAARSMSEIGHTDVRDHAPKARSSVGIRIDVEEAARMLELSHRQTRRLATSLEGVKSRSGIWSFDRRAVESYLAHQAEGKRA